MQFQKSTLLWFNFILSLFFSLWILDMVMYDSLKQRDKNIELYQNVI